MLPLKATSFALRHALPLLLVLAGLPASLGLRTGLGPWLGQALHAVTSNETDVPIIPGEGTCEEPVAVGSDGTFHVRCMSPGIPLRPGQATPYDLYVRLGNPYPLNEPVEVLSMSSQLVDSTRRPVPLSEVYLHHYVGNRHFILGEGSEIRGSMKRTPVHKPYGLVVDGQKLGADPYARYVNIQLINTVGVGEADMKQCLECWCQAGSWWEALLGGMRGNSPSGSFMCCTDCPTTAADMSEVMYHLEHNVTYRPLRKEVGSTMAPPKHMGFLGYDITGGDIEYQILAPNAPNNTHVLERVLALDSPCPQHSPITIVRCTAHQHVAGLCIELLNEVTGQLICRSCPILGTEPGVAGNEEGYVVSVTDDDLEPPVTLDPKTPVRLVSKYDASQQRLGVMGLFTVWVAGGTTEFCHELFNAVEGVGHSSLPTPEQMHMAGVMF